METTAKADEAKFIPSFEDDQLKNYSTIAVKEGNLTGILPIAVIATRNTARIQAQLGVFTIHHRTKTPVEAIGNTKHLRNTLFPPQQKRKLRKTCGFWDSPNFKSFLNSQYWRQHPRSTFMSYIDSYPLQHSNILSLFADRDQIIMNPDYQRQGDIWSKEKRQLLIDSILNRYDIPVYFHKLDRETVKKKGKTYAVIDGRQRLEAVFDFMEGGFELADDYEYLKTKRLMLAA